MPFRYLMEPASQMPYFQLALELEGRLNAIAFNKAWNKIVERHEIIRTLFRWKVCIMISPY